MCPQVHPIKADEGKLQLKGGEGGSGKGQPAVATGPAAAKPVQNGKLSGGGSGKGADAPPSSGPAGPASNAVPERDMRVGADGSVRK